MWYNSPAWSVRNARLSSADIQRWPMTDLTPYLPQLAVAWTAYLIATASPGPAIIAIIATSLSQGRRAGLTLASGVLTGSYIWAILTASGLSALIRTYGEAIIVLKIVGGCYLLWLAWNAYRAARKSEDAYRARLEKQYGSLDAKLAAFKATQTYLEQQIKMWTNQGNN